MNSLLGNKILSVHIRSIEVSKLTLVFSTLWLLRNKYWVKLVKSVTLSHLFQSYLSPRTFILFSCMLIFLIPFILLFRYSFYSRHLFIFISSVFVILITEFFHECYSSGHENTKWPQVPTVCFAIIADLKVTKCYLLLGTWWKIVLKRLLKKLGVKNIHWKMLGTSVVLLWTQQKNPLDHNLE